MNILEHPETHIVKLDERSMWQIFPGDIDHTLAWMPTTELRLFISDEVASHAPINSEDGTRVRVRRQGRGMAYRKAQGGVEAGMTLFGACNVSVADWRF
jgi:hypothetical protein